MVHARRVRAAALVEGTDNNADGSDKLLTEKRHALLHFAIFYALISKPITLIATSMLVSTRRLEKSLDAGDIAQIAHGRL